MREIKFRAWDKELETMVYSHELTGGVEYDCHPVRAINIILNEDDYNCEFMQYTGLKDKNGREIYEGDIVSDHVGIGVVEFTHSSYRVNYNDGYCKWFMDYLVSEYRTVEIIGNIHENPELLGDAK